MPESRATLPLGVLGKSCARGHQGDKKKVFGDGPEAVIFFYGLFMDADLLHAKGAEPVKIRPACAPGFALRIGQRATLLRNPDSRAYGILMELTHDEIEHLYSEASVRAYRPEAVLCELADGSRVAALCFNLTVPPAPEEADSEYAAKLRDLARRLGLPSDYVERI